MNRQIKCAYCGKDITNTEQFEIDGEYACLICAENEAFGNEK